MNAMLGRESARELLEVLGREELRPNGRFGRSHHALLTTQEKAEPDAGSAVEWKRAGKIRPWGAT
jgi:hypothetical protein